jgi:hypothetical protein
MFEVGLPVVFRPVPPQQLQEGFTPPIINDNATNHDCRQTTQSIKSIYFQ